MRKVWAREAPVTSDGPHYPLPLTGEGTTGLGKPLKPIVHPLRADIPIMLGAEGPKERRAGRRDLRRLAAHLLLPAHRRMYNEWLDEGFARPAHGARGRISRSARPPS